MKHLYKPFFIATCILLLGAFTSTSLGQTITLEKSASTMSENGGSVTLTARADIAPANGVIVTVTIAVTGGTATGGDYSLGSTTISIVGDGATTTGTTTLTGVADLLFEGNETVIVEITNVSDNGTGGGGDQGPYTESGAQFQVVQINDAETISILRSSSQVLEGATVRYYAEVRDDGGGSINGATVANGDVTVTVDWSTGTADPAADFSGEGNITITNGQSSNSVLITATDDSYLEGDETLIGKITALTYGVIGTNTDQTTIKDGESLILSGGATITEAGTATLTATVSGGGTLKLNGGGNLAITLTYTGTANYNADYDNSGLANPEALTLTDGSSSISTIITPVNDATIELDETAIAAMTTSGVTGLTLSGSPQTVTITDDVETVLLSPANAAPGQALNVPLSWSAVAGADQYKLYVNTASNFGGTAIVNGVDQGNVLTDTPGGLNDNTTYYWKVVPRNTGTSDTRAASDTEVRSFTTAAQSVSGISPSENSFSNSINPTLDWPDGPAGTDKYHLEVNTSSGFGAGTIVYDNEVVPNVETISTSTKALSGLSYNTKYYWRVTASSNSIPKVAAPTTNSFTTVLATPVNATPSGGFSGLYSTPTTFIWTMSSSYSNVDFLVTVYTTSGSPGTSTVGTSTVSNALTTTIAIPSAGVYYWTVKATVTSGTNINETNTSSETSFTLTLSGPSLTSPINGVTGVSIEPTFTWGAVTGAASYKLYVDDADDGFATPIYAVDQGALLTKTLTEIVANFPLANNTKYYWKVAAVDNNGNEFASSTYHFTTFPDLNPTLGWPTNGLTIYTTSDTFTWILNQQVGTLSIDVQYKAQATEPTPTEWTSGTTVSAGSALSKLISGLSFGSKYWWRIIVKNGSDIVDYSSAFWFTVGGGTSVTVTPSYPIGGTTAYSTTPTLYWYPNSFSSTTLTYLVRYSTVAAVDGDGMLTGVGGTVANLATTTAIYTTITPALTPGTTYYWQVRVSPTGPWSSVASFVTPGSVIPVVPTPSYPTGGVTIYTTAPQFWWSITGLGIGLTYDIEYNTSGAFTTNPTVSGIVGQYKIISGLTAGATYHWKVRSVSGTGTSPWSAEAIFTIAGGVGGGVPVVVSPTGNPTLLTTTPTLIWTLSGSPLGLTGYIVRYSTTDQGAGAGWTNFNPGSNDATGGKITVSGLAISMTTIPTALTYGGHYYWAVTTTDGSTESVPSTGEFTIVGGASAGIPLLSSPSNGSTVSTKSPTLFWGFSGSTAGIVGYEITYSISDVFAGGSPTTEVALTATTTQSYALSGLTSGATYYWKVRAHYGGAVYSGTSTTFSFLVAPGLSPIQPIVGGPTNNVVVATSAPTLSWIINAQANVPLSYELEIADNENMNNSNVIGGISKVYQEVNGLNSDKQYYWRVRSKKTDGSYSMYSGKGKFSTKFSVTAVDDINIIPKDFAVEQNYPNPFNPTTIIRFALPEASFVILKIYNMLGQEVRTLVNGQKDAGTFNVQWKGDNDFGQKVSSGAYIYRVIAGSHIFTKKMILLK